MQPTQQIDQYLASASPEWQKKNLELFRKLIHKVQPKIEEGWKWGVPVFILNGKLVCAMSIFKNHSKFNFFEGAKLKDKNKLFNSGLESKKSRSIDMLEGEKFETEKLASLIEEATNHLLSN